MSNLSEIKRRLVSARQTRKIIAAMETVSVAKMRKASDRLSGNKTYTELLIGMLNDLANSSAFSGDIFFNPPKSGKKLLVVLSSDNGLCGGFNHDIFKKADEIIDGDTTVIPIGAIGGEHYKNKSNVDMRFAGDFTADYLSAQSVSEVLIDEYEKGLSDVSIVYSVPDGSANKVCVKRILPILPGGGQSHTEIEATPEALSEVLVPLYVEGMVYNAFLGSGAAEHSARRSAMVAATESADNLIEELSTEYNRARQSSITEQIIEIIGATSAMGAKGAGQ